MERISSLICGSKTIKIIETEQIGGCRAEGGGVREMGGEGQRVYTFNYRMN